MNFWPAKTFYLKKSLLEKTVVIKRFQYFPLGKELKKKTSVTKEQYQKLESCINKEKKIEEVVLSGIYTIKNILLFANIITLMVLMINALLVQKQIFLMILRLYLKNFIMTLKKLS